VARMNSEQEVRFWRRFWSESLRIYGDKKGTYRDLVLKPMDWLGDGCAFLCDHDPPPDKPEFKFQKALDEKARRDWGK
jgi:hypothetical protein